VFAPKYCRQIIYGKLREDLGRILRDLCKRKNVEIIEANACRDHIHMLVNIPPKRSVSEFMGVFERKKLTAHIRTTCPVKVQIWKKKILVQGDTMLTPWEEMRKQYGNRYKTNCVKT
jgi:putative transposase